MDGSPGQGCPPRQEGSAPPIQQKQRHSQLALTFYKEFIKVQHTKLFRLHLSPHPSQGGFGSRSPVSICPPTTPLRAPPHQLHLLVRQSRFASVYEHPQGPVGERRHCAHLQQGQGVGAPSPHLPRGSPTPGIAQDQHQVQQGPVTCRNARCASKLQLQGTETNSRDCKGHLPVQRTPRILGYPFPGSGSPLQGLFCPRGPPHPASRASWSSDTREESMEAAAVPGPVLVLCSVPPLHRDRGDFAPACFHLPQQTDRHRPYHQQDDGSSNDAEAAHNRDGHTVLGRAWFGWGGLQGVLWSRAQQLAQPAGHRGSTPRGGSHPLSFGTQEAMHRMPITSI